MANKRMHEFSFTHHLALDIALTNRKLKILFDPDEDELFDKAMEHASKNGKGAKGKPDIMFRYGEVMVMIEVKHGIEKQIKYDWDSIHPCQCSYADKSSALTSDVASVVYCAENGAVHYLNHALEHKDLLLQKKIKTVLSIGAAFEDSDDFIAVPYCVDVETGLPLELHSFSDASFFQDRILRKNLKASRDKLNGNGNLSTQIVKMQEIVTGCSRKRKVEPVYVMILLWAMAMPGFRPQKLERKGAFDIILTTCRTMVKKFGDYPYAMDVLNSFRAHFEHGGLVPDCDFAEMAKRIDKELQILPTDYIPIVKTSFGLAPVYYRAELIADCIKDVSPKRVVDMGSSYGLPGIVSAHLTKTEKNLVLIENEPVNQLKMLAMLNLHGIREQNLLPDLRMVRGKLPKCFVADLTGTDDPLKHIRDMMIRVSPKMYGVFAVDRMVIESGDRELIESRRVLNSTYTLKKLIGCKDFFIVAIEKSLNDKGKKRTRYICGHYQPETHLKSLENGGIKFKQGTLNNGDWIKH